MATLKFPSDIESFASYIVFSAYDYDFSQVTKKELPKERIVKKQLLHNIILYAPGNIGESINAEWQSENIVLSSDIVDTIKEMSSKVSRLILDRSKIAGQVSAIKGVAISPTDMLVFRGNGFFTVSFSFDLIPRNANEAQSIEDIIKQFKKDSVGQYNTTTGNVLIEYPPIFDIEVVSVGGKTYSTKNKFLKYNKMVLISTNVTYSPNTESFLVFHDGKPVSINLTLNFTSILPLVKTDIVE